MSWCCVVLLHESCSNGWTDRDRRDGVRDVDLDGRKNHGRTRSETQVYSSLFSQVLALETSWQWSSGWFSLFYAPFSAVISLAGWHKGCIWPVKTARIIPTYVQGIKPQLENFQSDWSTSVWVWSTGGNQSAATVVWIYTVIDGSRATPTERAISGGLRSSEKRRDFLLCRMQKIITTAAADWLMSLNSSH